MIALQPRAAKRDDTISLQIAALFVAQIRRVGSRGRVLDVKSAARKRRSGRQYIALARQDHLALARVARTKNFGRAHRSCDRDALC